MKKEVKADENKNHESTFSNTLEIEKSVSVFSICLSIDLYFSQCKTTFSTEQKKIYRGKVRVNVGEFGCTSFSKKFI